jgi:hypothetical protein
LARQANFCEVWWILSPILDARLLNLELAKVAAIEPSRGLTPRLQLLLLDVAEEEEEGTAWRCALSTAEQNSLVRSRNDACEARVGFMAAGRAMVDLWPGSGSHPSPSASVGGVGGGIGEEHTDEGDAVGGRRGSARSVGRGGMAMGNRARNWGRHIITIPRGN